MALRDRSLFIAWGGGGGPEDFGGDHIVFWETEGGSGVIDRHKGGDQNKKNGISGGGGISMNI